MKIIFCKKCKKFHDVILNCQFKPHGQQISNLNSLSNRVNLCNLCNGSGKFFDSGNFYLGFNKGIFPCPKCNGKGTIG